MYHTFENSWKHESEPGNFKQVGVGVAESFLKARVGAGVTDSPEAGTKQMMVFRSD